MESAACQHLRKDCGRRAESGQRAASSTAAHHLSGLEVQLNAAHCRKPVTKGGGEVFSGEKEEGISAAAARKKPISRHRNQKKLTDFSVSEPKVWS